MSNSIVPTTEIQAMVNRIPGMAANWFYTPIFRGLHVMDSYLSISEQITRKRIAEMDQKYASMATGIGRIINTYG